MSDRASQIRSLIIGCIIIYALGYAAATTSFYWLRDESPKQAYERGYEDARSVLLDTLYYRWLNDSIDWHLSINATSNISWYSTESDFWYDVVDSTDTMPAEELIYTDTFYKLDGVWRMKPLDRIE